MPPQFAAPLERIPHHFQAGALHELPEVANCKFGVVYEDLGGEEVVVRIIPFRGDRVMVRRNQDGNVKGRAVLAHSVVLGVDYYFFYLVFRGIGVLAVPSFEYCQICKIIPLRSFFCLILQYLNHIVSCRENVRLPSALEANSGAVNVLACLFIHSHNLIISPYTRNMIIFGFEIHPLSPICGLLLLISRNDPSISSCRSTNVGALVR